MELTSLDRLLVLKDRVLISVNEYKTLLKSLDRAFNVNNLELIDTLLLKEQEILKTLTSRVKIFKSHINFLKNIDDSTILIKTEVYNTLNELNKEIEQFQSKLNKDKMDLKIEMNQVKKRIKPMGKSKDYTARRIDIIT